MKFRNFQLLKLSLCAVLFSMLFATTVFASSHREAPLISNDPLADNTDLYAFRSPDDPNTVTIIATYIPMQLPHGGPNYYTFGTDIRYEIHVDNDASIPGDEIIYRFTFSQENEDPTTFFNIRLGQQNLKTTYTMERSTDGGASFSTVITGGVVPPNNIGPRSIESPVGLGTTYGSLMEDAISTTSQGEKVFAGPVDDPFFVDLGGIFDLGDAPRQGENARDGLACYNVSAIAIQIPISLLLKDGAASQPTTILDPDYVIGVWASASRPQIRTFGTDGPEYSGDWVQVSRLGMPLTNEAVIPIGFKDYWNAISPYDEISETEMDGFFYNPELALYMDDDQFGGAVPAFSPLRIQTSSLGAFDFTNGADGLFSLKGSEAVAGTALDDDVFGTLLLPGAGLPRSVDLWPIFHTGVPNVIPYQLATGKDGNPLAMGKPFINNFLPNGGDMLRLNMAVPVTDRDGDNFSSLGLIQAAVVGLTDPTYANTDIEFIPNMDGFPNGRRLEDDVTRIELQAVGGAVLAAVGLWYDDFTPGESESPVTQDLLDVLTYTTGVEENDVPFRSTFPYLAMPFSGTGDCSGKEIIPSDDVDPTSDGVDLELQISTPSDNYPQFAEVPYTLTLTNTGAANATGISVSASLPQGLVFTSADASTGSYSLFNGSWDIDMLAAGETATLTITLFTLDQVSEATNFVQVTAVDQMDADSTPGNNNTMTPEEDDEAVAMIVVVGNGGNGVGQLFVSSNNQGKVGVYNIFEGGAVSMSAFEAIGMDADGIHYNPSQDRLTQLNRSDNVINTFEKVNFNTSMGNEPMIGAMSTSDFSNGREIAVTKNAIIVAQDANDGNNNQNRLYYYENNGSSIDLVETYNVDINLWGIILDNSTLYAIVDNSDQLAVYDDFFSQTSGDLEASRIIDIEGIVRTHGITYYAETDMMILTDVGAASSDSDGGFAVIKNFAEASADGTVSMDEQIRIYGSQTFLGNPVDVAYDDINDRIYITERAKDGGRVLGFNNPASSGNVAPVYNSVFMGASGIDFSKISQPTAFNDEEVAQAKLADAETEVELDVKPQTTTKIAAVYPVPATTQVTVSIVSETNADLNMLLMDAQGRVLMQMPQAVFEGQNDMQIDVSKFPSGYYYLSILDRNNPRPTKEQTHRILKMD